ncbi:MAG: hypothetical protein ACREBD_13880 [Blastocatellia bacterium]
MAGRKMALKAQSVFIFLPAIFLLWRNYCKFVCLGVSMRET